MLNVNTLELKEGMVVAADVKDARGRLLVQRGTPLTDRHLKAFKVWGVAAVQIEGGAAAGGGAPAPRAQAAPAGAAPKATQDQIRAQVVSLFRNCDRQHPFMAELFKLTCERAVANSQGTKKGRPIKMAKPPKKPLTGEREPVLKPQDLVQNIGPLSSLPSVYMRLSEVIDHPQSSARDIALVLEDDSGLAARLLRLTNSAFFGFPAKVETLSKAVSIVGTQQLRDLALATSVVSMFKKIPSSIVDMQSFWEHSVATGICSRLIASMRKEANAERYFVAGLLHDIGSMILYTTMPHRSFDILTACYQSGISLHVAEKQVLGYGHDALGHAVVELWNLPPCHREAIRSHHRPDGTQGYALESSVVHIADIICHAALIGGNGERFVPPLFPQAWSLLKLPTSTIAKLVEEVEGQVDEVMKIMGMTE